MAGADASISYRFCAGLSGLESVGARWVELGERLGERKGLAHILFWYRCQIRCLGGCEGMGFSTAWEGERLVAVLPLMLGSRGAKGLGMLGFSRLEFPSDPYNFYSDATIDPTAAAKISLARLVDAARGPLGASGLLELRRLRADATLLELAGVRRLSTASGANCLYVPLHAGMKPDEALSRQSRVSLNQRRNRLRRVGALEWKHAPDDLPIDEALQIFLALEASGWKGESGTATKYQPARLAFLQKLAGGGDGLKVYVHLLMAGGAPVAAMYGMNVGDVHLNLLSGYDERYARASPGHLLIHEVIRWAVARGLREVDFMSCAAHWRRWHPAERSMHEVMTSDGSVKGVVVEQARRLRRGLRKSAP